MNSNEAKAMEIAIRAISSEASRALSELELKLETKDKQIQILNKRLARQGGNCCHASPCNCEFLLARARAEKAEKERDILNERLARMGEVLEFLSEEMPRPMGPDDDDNDWEMVAGRKISNALSSHDPDWMAARLREAKAEAFIEASEMIVEMKLNGGTIAGTIAPMRVLAKQYCQPNQSREEKG